MQAAEVHSTGQQGQDEGVTEPLLPPLAHRLPRIRTSVQGDRPALQTRQPSTGPVFDCCDELPPQVHLTRWQQAYLWIQNNRRRFICLAALFIIYVLAFLWEFSRYATNLPLRNLMGWSLPIAKGCSQCMKFTWALILLPVSRNSVTTLRETWLKKIIPFDDAISYHRLLGMCGGIFALIHTLCHVNDFMRAGSPRYASEYFIAFPDDPVQPSVQDYWRSYTALTGVGMVAIFLVAYLFALPWPRTAKAIQGTWLGKALNNFNYFWYTHHLFAAFYVLLIVHPLPALPPRGNYWGRGNTWLWVAVPLLVYVLERTLRTLRAGIWKTEVLSAVLLSDEVMTIHVNKPRRFKFKPGQYAFLQIPEISSFEWHPFTISSAPGDDYISFHIKAAGDWTLALYERLQKTIGVREQGEDVEGGYLSDDRDTQQPRYGRKDGTSSAAQTPAAMSTISEGNRSMRKTNSVADLFSVGGSEALTNSLPGAPRINLDGPYGAPMQNYTDYSILVLVGAGIGVTPMASLMHHVLNLFHAHRCRHCGKVNLTPDFRIKKVHMHWAVRDATAAAWFRSEFERLAQDDHDRLIDIHIHITRRPDVSPSNLQSLGWQDPEQNNVTMHYGRPQFDGVFTELRQRHRGRRIGVFYCGPPVLARTLDQLSVKNSVPGETKFDFWEEHF